MPGWLRYVTNIFLAHCSTQELEVLERVMRRQQAMEDQRLYYPNNPTALPEDDHGNGNGGHE